jgi:hypothetical protein
MSTKPTAVKRGEGAGEGKKYLFLFWLGHLEVLQWARANGCQWTTDNCFHAAARGGYLEVLQRMWANGYIEAT